MSDFNVSMGCGDIPTNDLNNDCISTVVEETAEEIQEKIDKGFVKDSCGQWYDPTSYIDSYYTDW
jgi:hypothetical protein